MWNLLTTLPMPPREHEQWPGQATRADRRRARRNIQLEDVGITPSTLQRYYLSVRRLAPVLKTVNTEPGLDDAVASWI